MSSPLHDVGAVLGAATERMLSVAPSPAFWIAAVLYAGAAIAFALAATGRFRVGGLARVLFAGAFLAHAVDIGWRGVQHVHPAETVRESLGFLAWIMAGGYLVSALRWRIDLAGAVVSPLVMVVLAGARLSPAGDDPEGLNTLGRIHITLATIGVGIFALASALAAIYLLEERSLKRKRFDTLAFKSGGAPLERLDILLHRLVWVGFPIFTAAVILGVIWVSERDGRFNRPEYPLALVTWSAYAVLLVTRSAFGWRGRRAARLTLVGFGVALLVLLIYLARRIWGG